MTDELTPEMICAGRRAAMAYRLGGPNDDALTAIYTAMHSSLPNPEGQVTEALRKAREYINEAAKGTISPTSRPRMLLAEIDAALASTTKVAADEDAEWLRELVKDLPFVDRERDRLERIATRLKPDEGLREREDEGLETTADTHIMLSYENAPPYWPTVGQLKRWLEVIRAPAALASTTRVAADEPMLTQAETDELVERINANPNLQPAPDEDAEWLRDFAAQQPIYRETLERIATRLKPDEGLREVLRFYADEWEQDVDAERTVSGWEGSIGDAHPTEALYRDRGDKARAALAHERGGR